MHANPVRRSTRPGVARLSRASVAVLAAVALLLGACGDDDTADVAEETTTAPTTAAEHREAVVSSPEDATEPLLGVWEFSSGVSWEISEGVITVTDGHVDWFSYTATASTIELMEDAGTGDCGQPGIYEWEVEDDVLSLAVVTDECSGRHSGLNGATAQRL